MERSERTFTTVSAALNAAGIGRAQWFLLGFCGLAWAADAMETMILSFLGPSVKCAWPDAVTSTYESILTSVVFLGMLIGVYSLGAAADAFGRRKGFFLSAFLLGAAGLASAAAPSFGWLLLLRCLVGAALGGTPIAVTLFSECAPSAKRGALVLALQSAWTIGTIAEALLAWAVLPTVGWRAMLACSALPTLLLLVGYPWLPESPLWLVAQNRPKEAEQVVRNLAIGSGVHPQALKLRFASTAAVHRNNAINPSASINPSAGTKHSVSAALQFFQRAFGALFSPRFAKTTSLLWGVWFVNAITYYGLVLLTTALQAESKGRGNACTADGHPAFTSRDYLAVVVTSAGEIPGLVAAALLVDVKGRLWCIRMGLVICGCCLLGLLSTDASSIAVRLILLFVARAAEEGTFSVLYVYTPEIYPTHVRSFGLGTCNAFSRIGGFAAPFATVFLVEGGHANMAALLLGSLCLSAAAAAMFLPIETQGHALELVADGDGGGELQHDHDGNAEQTDTRSYVARGYTAGINTGNNNRITMNGLPPEVLERLDGNDVEAERVPLVDGMSLRSPP